jgi:hypothetical protein
MEDWRRHVRQEPQPHNDRLVPDRGADLRAHGQRMTGRGRR